MVTTKLVPISYLKGDEGDKGTKGDTGTFENATAESVAAGTPAAAEIWGARKENVHFKIPRGLPGVNAIPAADAVAEYVAAQDSPVRGELEQLFPRKDSLTVNLADHGVDVFNANSDDTDTVQALINTVPEGTTIWAPVGSVLRTRGWTVADKSITFDFSNAHVVKLSPAPILYAVGEWTTPVSVGGVTQGDATSTVTVGSNAGFAVGDLIKVFSDDVIWDARNRASGMPAGLYRQGEFGTISELPSPSTMLMTPGVIDPYSTNIRVAKMSDAKVVFKFGTLDYAGAGADGGGFSGRYMFHFKGLRAPVLEGHVLAAPGLIVDFQSCFGAYADIVVDRTSQADGYGVDSRGSVFGEYHIVQLSGRHAFTDNPANTTLIGATDPSDFGRSMYETIYGRSVGLKESHWDTHHGGYGHKFIGITATGSQVGGTPGFSLRGRNHQLISCSANGFSRGFRILQEEDATWATSEGHEFVSCTAANCYTAIEAGLKRELSDNNTLTVTGGTYGSTTGVNVFSHQARIKFDNPTFHIWGSSSTNSKFTFTRTHVYGKLDVYMHADVNMDAVMFSTQYFSRNRNKIDLDVHFITPSALGGGFRNFLRANDADVNLRVRSTRPLPIPILAGATLGPARQQYTLTAMESSDSGTSSAQRRIDVTGSTVIGPGSAGDPVVVVLVSAASAVTASGLQPGSFAGQMMVISNSMITTTGTITIPDGGNARLGGAKSIAANQSLTLVWNTALQGSAWCLA